MFIDKMNKFGYSEMYEWSELFKYDIVPYGRFVTFDKIEPGKICLANSDDQIIGVTTINSVCESDNPEEWQGKYLCNEYGDILIKKIDRAYARKDYDSELEMPLIATYKKTDVVPIINEDFNADKTYVKRTDRNEWIRVNILGKCVVVDDGTCEPGKYCCCDQNGIATYKHNHFSTGYYVISRLSDNTILIFFK